MFGPVGVACGPINTLREVYRDPQVLARGMVFEMEHPVAGKVPLTSNPIRYRERPIDYQLPPPVLGQHTRSVLSDVLGLGPGENERLSSEGSI